MAGPFYFAYVGGVADPALTLNTTGDLWGGSHSTFGDVWGGTLATTGNLTNTSATISGVDKTESLISGNVYDVTGNGIPPGATATYSGGTTLTLSSPATVTQVAASIQLSDTGQRSIVSGVQDIAPLVVGRTYSIAASGIPAGTTFVFDGNDTFEISAPATSTAALTALTISSPLETNIVKNLASTAGLTVGQTYGIWGPGVPANTFFTYVGGTDVTLTADANLTTIGGFLSIRKGITEDDGGAFNSATHMVEDEDLFSFELAQQEGDFATLRVEIENPRVGLLTASRKQWCWLSWDSAWQPGVATNPANLVPLFHGRMMGAPTRMANEIVVLDYVGRPTDYFVQKSIIAAALQVAPYWDPVWIQKGVNDPDTVLEARSALWHIDRTTLEVTTSDIIDAEGDTIEILESEHFYEGVDFSYSEQPLTSVNVTASVTWIQSGDGEVDLSAKLVEAFQAAGSPFSFPFVGSFMSDGLVSTWPAPNASLGGGWTMSQDSSAEIATWAPVGKLVKKYSAPSSSQPTQFEGAPADSAVANGSVFNPAPADFATTTGTGFGAEQAAVMTYSNWDATFEIKPIDQTFLIHYEAARNRSERLLFVLNADIQPILVDPNGADTEIVELSSDFVSHPVDPGGELPIGDVGRNSYFTTDRGQQSIEFLLTLARAKLRAKSRAVRIVFSTDAWDKIIGLTCRDEILLHNRYLPGGQALGKVVNYRLAMSAESGMTMQVTIGCAIGTGNTLSAPTASSDYIDDDYIDVDYFELETGSTLEVVAGELQYEALDGTYVIDDDGVDLFNMTPDSVLLGITITNGPGDQLLVINEAADAKGSIIPDPVGALKNAPTRVEVDVVPVAGGDFQTDFVVNVTNLQMPKMIDLEAA